MKVIDFNINYYIFGFEIYLILFLEVHEWISSDIYQILIKIIV